MTADQFAQYIAFVTTELGWQIPAGIHAGTMDEFVGVDMDNDAITYMKVDVVQ